MSPGTIHIVLPCYIRKKQESMTLGDFRTLLNHLDELTFMETTGFPVPAHFHITEVGQLDRFFIDCGGTVRKTSKVNFQMYVDQDVDHRLSVDKLKGIIDASLQQLGLNPQLELQVEYQGTSIESYGLSYENGVFSFQALHTDCLSKDKCGIPEKPSKKKVALGTSSCAPGSGCC